ncbi:MAG: hypothetical protein WCL44_06305 [bacterium]
MSTYRKCRYGTGDRRQDRGAVLGVVLIVLLIFSILGFQLLELSGRDGVETARAVGTTRAFWVAEAGLHHARAMLLVSSAFRASPWTLTGGGLNYSAATEINPDGTYTVTSAGTAQTLTRTVQQVIEVRETLPLAFDYILFGGSGDMTIRKEAVINGDVFQNGDITFADATVTGTVYATGTVSGHERTDPGNPPPAMPELDTSYYDALIAYARTNGGASLTYPLNLGGATLYVRGNEAVGDLTGPGTLVISEDASIGKELSIGHNVQVISGGTFSIAKNLQGGSNALLYAATGFNIAKSADVSIGNCILITPGDISASKNLSISGLMFASGSITMKKDATVVGCAVAGQGFTIFKAPRLTYDASQLPTTFPPGIPPETRLIDIIWRELL